MSDFVFFLSIAGSVVVIALTYWWGRSRAAHICQCGHRRDQHSEEFFDYCDHCSCEQFERRSNR